MSALDTPFTLLIIIANVLLSIRGFQDMSFLERNLFSTEAILKKRQYGRLINSGFIHADVMHLFFNMFTLFSFGRGLEFLAGPVFFSSVYGLSLLGGSFLTLFIHRNEPSYRALGASGAVSGVLFSFILLFPESKVDLFVIKVPGWTYGAIYTIYTLYGMRSRMDNIGHDAHLGGAIIGMLTTIGFYPILLQESLTYILMLIVPSIVFIYLLVKHPHLVGVQPSPTVQKRKEQPIDDHAARIRAEKQQEMNRILEKIQQSGMESLSDYEKRFWNMNK